MDYRITEATRLINKYKAYNGMVSEVLMKCRLLKGKVQAARRAGTEDDPALEELVNNSLTQYRLDLSTYKKKMRRIYRQVEELCH
jgi:hypothetical protein